MRTKKKSMNFRYKLFARF